MILEANNPLWFVKKSIFRFKFETHLQAFEFCKENLLPIESIFFSIEIKFEVDKDASLAKAITNKLAADVIFYLERLLDESLADRMELREGCVDCIKTVAIVYKARTPIILDLYIKHLDIVQDIVWINSTTPREELQNIKNELEVLSSGNVDKLTSNEYCFLKRVLRGDTSITEESFNFITTKIRNTYDTILKLTPSSRKFNRRRILDATLNGGKNNYFEELFKKEELEKIEEIINRLRVD